MNIEYILYCNITKKWYKESGHYFPKNLNVNFVNIETFVSFVAKRNKNIKAHIVVIIYHFLQYLSI